MLRIGRNISRVARLMALVVTPLFVFESTASAQVTVGPAGAQLGAFIEGDRCHCDDPGLKGALIGAPVGAVTGGILGAKFF